MKLKVGYKLLELRKERKQTQEDIADLLCISLPTYSRIERNETQIDMNQLISFSEKLDIPIQEFLPETISIVTKNNDRGVGIVFGNYIFNADKDSYSTELKNEIEQLKFKIAQYVERIEHLEKANLELINKIRN